MARTPNLDDISPQRQRIAKLASEDAERSFLSLAHHIDDLWLRVAFYLTRRDGAPGVDGQTWSDYEKDLGSNLQSLLDRFKSGRYKAPPVKRLHIPKGGDPRSTRPIGIPTLEDKVLQRAVQLVLESVYEEDFLDCSYGYRPKRSARDAVESLWQGLMGLGGGWVLEVDIQSFFDDLDHDHLRSFLDQRIRDGVLRRTIGKWLNAGVLEDGRLSFPERGTPQGGVISPLLANLYLHEVVDRWFQEDVLPRLRHRAFLIRFADDMVFVFESERDARRVEAVLAARFARFGLRLHPTKTRCVNFQRPSGRDDSGGEPGSFSFLGFTHYWGVSRRGQPVVVRKTASSRVSRTLRRIHQWCRRHRHEPVWWQHQKLTRQLLGHYAYYGITGNYRTLDIVYRQSCRSWRKWLNRRSQKAKVTWEKFFRILTRYPLPRPRIVHSYVKA
jgi:group II intron reverse transcriptase/maturase